MENAMLTEMKLIDNAVKGTDNGTVRVYTCNDNFHYYGNTTITLQCLDDGWTNQYQSCIPGEYTITHNYIEVSVQLFHPIYRENLT